MLEQARDPGRARLPRPPAARRRQGAGHRVRLQGRDHRRTQDPARLGRDPAANIGIACGASGIVVLDIDPKAGTDPEDVLGELELGGAPVILTGEAPEPSEQYPDSLSGVRGCPRLLHAAISRA